MNINSSMIYHMLKYLLFVYIVSTLFVIVCLCVWFISIKSKGYTLKHTSDVKKVEGFFSPCNELNVTAYLVNSTIVVETSFETIVNVEVGPSAIANPSNFLELVNGSRTSTRLSIIPIADNQSIRLSQQSVGVIHNGTFTDHERLIDYMTDDRSCDDASYRVLLSLRILELPAGKSFTLSSRHFQVICSSSVMKDPTALAKMYLFCDTGRPLCNGNNINDNAVYQDIMSAVNSAPENKRDGIILQAFVYLLLFSLEDWRYKVINLDKFKDPTFFPQKYSTHTSGRREKSLIVIGGLENNANIDAWPELITKFPCGACGLENGLNVNIITARALPISGGITHEFGHTIQMAYASHMFKEGIIRASDGNQGVRSGIQNLSESFSEWFVLRSQLEQNNFSPSNTINVGAFFTLNVQNHLLCSSRARYQTSLWFQYQLENPFFSRDEGLNLINTWLQRKCIAYHSRSTLPETYKMFQNTEHNMFFSLDQHLKTKNKDIKDFICHYAMQYVSFSIFSAALPLQRACYPYRKYPTEMLTDFYYTSMCHPSRVPDNPGMWMVNDANRMQQVGFNIIPLIIDPSTQIHGQPQSISIQGLNQGRINSDWRFGLVMLKENQFEQVFQSRIYKNNTTANLTGNFTVATNDVLYLVVSAVPGVGPEDGRLLEYHDMGNEIWLPMATTPLKMFHPYEFKLVGIKPHITSPLENGTFRDIMAAQLGQNFNDNALFRTHQNGEGRVHKESHVDATAFVGQNCVVFRGCKVLGNAKLLDNAIIYVQNDLIQQCECIVKDNAIMSDCAQAFNNCIIEENAQIMDFSYVFGGRGRGVGKPILKGYTRVIENGKPQARGGQQRDSIFSGNITVKGKSAPDQFECSGAVVTDWDFFDRGTDILRHGFITGQFSDPKYKDIFEKSEYREAPGFPKNIGNEYVVYNFDPSLKNDVYVMSITGISHATIRGTPTFGRDTVGSFMASTSARAGYLMLPASCNGIRNLRVTCKFKLNSVSNMNVLFTLGSISSYVVVFVSGGKINMTIKFGSSLRTFESIHVVNTTVMTLLLIKNGDTGSWMISVDGRNWSSNSTFPFHEMKPATGAEHQNFLGKDTENNGLDGTVYLFSVGFSSE